MKFHVILTTYEMVLQDKHVLSQFVQPIRGKGKGKSTFRHEPFVFGCLIIDEGHRLKSRSAKLFQALRVFKIKQRLLLTGTPLVSERRPPSSLSPLGKGRLTDAIAVHAPSPLLPFSPFFFSNGERSTSNFNSAKQLGGALHADAFRGPQKIRRRKTGRVFSAV